MTQKEFYHRVEIQPDVSKRCSNSTPYDHEPGSYCRPPDQYQTCCEFSPVRNSVISAISRS